MLSAVVDTVSSAGPFVCLISTGDDADDSIDGGKAPSRMWADVVTEAPAIF